MDSSRRRFLTYLGIGTYAALTDPLGTAARAARPLRSGGRNPAAFFEPIRSSRDDLLKLPAGFRHDLVSAWGDDLGSRHATFGPETFGCNCDFLAYFPADALEGAKNSRDGLLWVNHEYPSPVFVSNYSRDDYQKGVVKQPAQIRAEMLCVGGSVLHVQRDGVNGWRRIADPKPRNHTRRLTALYPTMEFTGPVARAMPELRPVGTLANCSGGRTPWYTALSCEENYDFCVRGPAGSKRYVCFRWDDDPLVARTFQEEHYGWVVEVDPFGELKPQKHSALGRFKHENAALRLGPSGRLVIYMGDDEADQYLYKFVSADAYRAGDSREAKRKLLQEGTLYAADLEAGKWLPLDVKRNRKMADRFDGSQARLLLNTRIAAREAGATPMDRPEDCEVHPLDGTLYVALSNSRQHGNLFGQIIRLLEHGDNPEGEAFRFEIFLAGGPQSGLACPDNMLFDKKGNLWVACDMPSDGMNNPAKGAYLPFGNNGLFVVPTTGPAAGDALQFASGPVQCELTGPWFTEDEETLFLAVQHPGEESPSAAAATSHWPEGGNRMPRPSVVAVTGFRW